MESKYFIQVFPNGLGTEPRLTWVLPKSEYSISEGMVHIQDPRTNLTKSFPTSICMIDEVKQ